jgi:hypothetical protein
MFVLPRTHGFERRFQLFNGVSMSISVLQSTGNSANTTAQSWSQAFGSNVTKGSMLVACYFAGSRTVTASIGDGGNVWTPVGNANIVFAGLNGTLYVWTAPNTLSGVGDTVQVSVTGGSNIHGNLFCIAEISGVNAVDQTGTNTGQTASGTTFTAASVTTQQANEIIISAGAGNSTAFSPITPFSLLGASAGTSSFATAEYDVVSSTNMYTPTFSVGNGSTGCGSVTFSLYQSGGGSSNAGLLKLLGVN